MELAAAVHIAASLLALVSGTAVFLLRKGTPVHRFIGRSYVVAMLATNVTALLVYRLTGAFGPFHAAALVSLATVIPAFAAAYRRRPGWLQRHYFLMAFSYVGLVAAAVSEVATRAFVAPFWAAVAIASLAVLVAGAALVFVNAERQLAPFRAVAPDPSSKRTAGLIHR
jgi:uncharacterized membrane protein